MKMNSMQTGIDMGKILGTVSALKTARLNRDINQFKLGALETEQKKKQEFTNFMAENPDADLREVAVRFPEQVMPVVEAVGKADEVQRTQMKQNAWGMAALIDSVLELPEEQRPARYAQIRESMPEQAKAQAPAEYDETFLRGIRNWYRKISGDPKVAQQGQNAMNRQELAGQQAMEQIGARHRNAMTEAQTKGETVTPGQPRKLSASESNAIRSNINNLYEEGRYGRVDENGRFIMNNIEYNKHRQLLIAYAERLYSTGKAPTIGTAAVMAREELGFPLPKVPGAQPAAGQGGQNPAGAPAGAPSMEEFLTR